MLFCLCANTSYPISGGYCGEVPPLPIPNREVKLTCADGTAMQCGRVGSRLLLLGSLDYESSRGFFCHADFADDADFFFAAFPFFPQISQIYTDFLTCSVLDFADFLYLCIRKNRKQYYESIYKDYCSTAQIA